MKDEKPTSSEQEQLSSILNHVDAVLNKKSNLALSSEETKRVSFWLKTGKTRAEVFKGAVDVHSLYTQPIGNKLAKSFPNYHTTLNKML